MEFKDRIKKILNWQTTEEKINECAELENESNLLKAEIDILAQDFRDRTNDFNKAIGIKENAPIVDILTDRYNKFLTIHTKDISGLKSKHDSINNRLTNIQKSNPEIIKALNEIKAQESFKEIRKAYTNKELSFDTFNDIIKAKKGKVQYADTIVFNSKGEILLLQRNDDSGFEPNKFCIPGGHVDLGEDTDDAATRELAEETGIVVDILDEVGIYSDSKVEIYYYQLNLNEESPTIILYEKEHKGLKWAKFDKMIPDEMIPGLYENLEKILFPHKQSIIAIKKAFDNGILSPELFKKALESVIKKARSGVYENTQENKKLGRVGQKYGSKKETKVTKENISDIFKDKIHFIPESDIFDYEKETGENYQYYLKNGYKKISETNPIATKNDYWLATKGTFETSPEIKKEWEEIEEDNSFYVSTRAAYNGRQPTGSTYKIKDGYLYRNSNHWGNVASCNWNLKNGDKFWSYGIGKIKLSNLQRKSNIYVLTIEGILKNKELLNKYLKAFNKGEIIKANESDLSNAIELINGKFNIKELKSFSNIFGKEIPDTDTVDTYALYTEAQKSNMDLDDFIESLPFVDIEIEGLIPTQDFVDWDKLSEKLKGKGDKDRYPFIIRKDGLNYIFDGHHRLSAAKLNGEKTDKVNLFDEDSLNKYTEPQLKELIEEHEKLLPLLEKYADKDDDIKAEYERQSKELEGYKKDLKNFKKAFDPDNPFDYFEKGHKYLRKEPDGKGGFNYIYEENKGRNQGLKEVLNKTEKEIVKLDYEHGYCFNEKGKEIFNHTEKKENSIEFSEDQLSKMKGNILTHNHPAWKKNEGNDLGKYGINFSPKDIGLLCENELKEMRCVSGEYVYSLSKKDGSNFEMKDFHKFMSECEKEEKELDKYFRPLYEKGEKSENITVAFFNTIYKIVSEKLKINYKRQLL